MIGYSGYYKLQERSGFSSFVSSHQVNGQRRSEGQLDGMMVMSFVLKAEPGKSYKTEETMVFVTVGIKEK